MEKCAEICFLTFVYLYSVFFIFIFIFFFLRSLIWGRYFYLFHAETDDPRVLQLMDMWGPDTRGRWPIGVVWFATYLVFLGTSYGTKRTYRSAVNSFTTIFRLLNIPNPFQRTWRSHPAAQIDVFMALATMASYKAASTCRGAKSAAEDA